MARIKGVPLPRAPLRSSLLEARRLSVRQFKVPRVPESPESTTPRQPELLLTPRTDDSPKRIRNAFTREAHHVDVKSASGEMQ